MRLTDLALFARRSGGDDFELVVRGASPSRAVEQGAAQWLQAHLDSGNEKTVTLARLDGGWWLVRGASEDATDAAGRRRSHLVLALDGEPAAEAVGPLLLAAYQAGLPSWQLAEPQELATGAPPYPVVAAPELASDALARVGLDHLDFAALMPLAAPDAPTAALRPDRVAAVAALPGWEHWRGA